MKKNLSEIVFIIDKSGSMSGLESDTIGGFNTMIAKQKDVEGECIVSVVTFNSASEVVYDRVLLEEIKEMTEKDYVPCGSTALIDALGGAIHHIGNVHKYIRDEDVPEHTTFVVTTDGMENSSNHYSSDKVKKMIENQKEKYGWEFLFIGANIDAVETAGRYGIDADYAVNYHADEKGTEILYECVGKALRSRRRCGTVSNEWRCKIDEDYKSR